MNVSPASYLDRYIESLLIGLKYNPAVANILGKHGWKGFITCSGKKDGAGAQALAIMSTILFARDLGLTYLHTPFSQIAHNSDRNNLWEYKWENFLSLGKGELHINDVQKSGIEVVDLYKLSKLSINKPNILYNVRECHKYANLFPDRYLNLSNIFRTKYLASDKTIYDLNTSSQKINVAIHVRRGDINSSGLYSVRYTHNSCILNILNRIIKVLNDLGLDSSICLYSQGKIEDFGELQNLNINFHLNQCVFTTFHQLVTADIFLMSKSTFSYTAALLSEGIKIYEHFYHRPLKDWLLVDRKANFPEKVLRHQLSEKWVSDIRSI
ncbi:MAG: hypothetical protein NWQ43_00315 [Dolichospermum sp.]|nr:hypothetical protein [Dolichospermum sp.]